MVNPKNISEFFTAKSKHVAIHAAIGLVFVKDVHLLGCACANQQLVQKRAYFHIFLAFSRAPARPGGLCVVAVGAAGSMLC